MSIMVYRETKVDSVNPSVHVSCFDDNKLDVVKQYINKKSNFRNENSVL